MADTLPPSLLRPNTSASRKRGWIVLRGRGDCKLVRGRSAFAVATLIEVSAQIAARSQSGETAPPTHPAVQFVSADRTGSRPEAAQ